VLDPLADRIRAIPATTFAGLAVKAQVVKFVAFEWWNENDEPADADGLDLPDEHCRLLVDDLLAIAGRAV
jgi:hypothetical protein